jgi:protein-S-isoprenylcysteine O-methyltransferase Ste14
MSEELSFRIALLMIILVTTSIAVYFRHKADSQKEKVSYVQEGLLFRIALRLSTFALVICVFIYLIDPSIVSWASFSVPFMIRWMSVGIAGLGSILMFLTLKRLGKNLTDTVITRSNARLVTDGPYRWVRHPYYVATALIMISVCFVTANWLIGASSLLVLALLIIRTPTEEAFLIKRFGQEYLDYQSRTGMFFPRLQLVRQVR